ncbi:hypothetical protein [Micromonospora sp. KC207]|uniref:hypothetical protein n=1 Tax=Micromonospora sp. KC207 TaxID=2530377 RepID=UPI0014049399|nr:hypothetical protein [Micromonospora sp. KC207]
MDNVVSIDYEPVRQRFPWVGLVNTGEQDLSGRYRKIMAEAQPWSTGRLTNPRLI